MSSTHNPETTETMHALMAHVHKLNDAMRKANVKNGDGERWLNQNIPDWKTSVDGRVTVADTRFGYPEVFPRFRQRPPGFGSGRKPIIPNLD